MKKIKSENLIEWTGPLKPSPFPGLPSLSKNQNPLIAKDIGFVSTFKSKKVMAFDPKNGDVSWVYDLGVYGGTPLIVDRKFIFAGTHRGVVCLNRKSGKMNWKYDPHTDKEESFYSEPVKNGDDIFVLDRYGNLHKLNATSGKVKYCVNLAAESTGQFNARIAIKAGKIYAISTTGFLVCLKMNTGDILWTTDLGEGSIHAITISGNSLLIQGETRIFEVNTKNRNTKRIKFNGIVDTYLKKGILYVLDRKSKDDSATVLFEYKRKKKKLLQIPGLMSAFVPFENKGIISFLGPDGIIFCDIKNKTKKFLVEGLYSPNPYISKNRIFAIDLMHEVICIKNPLSLKSAKVRG